VNVVNPDQFFSDFSRDVTMATNFGPNWRNNFHSSPWHFGNGIEYRSMDKQLYSANDPSTSCTNIVNFSPVMPEIEV